MAPKSIKNESKIEKLNDERWPAPQSSADPQCWFFLRIPGANQDNFRSGGGAAKPSARAHVHVFMDCSVVAVLWGRTGY